MERFNTKGVCASAINFEIEDNKIKHIDFERGCDGNLKGLSVLAIGMDVDEAIKKLEGITCGSSTTSCPDQLSIALKEYKENNK